MVFVPYQEFTGPSEEVVLSCGAGKVAVGLKMNFGASTTANANTDVQSVILCSEPDGAGNWRVRTSQWNRTTQILPLQTGYL